MIISTVRMKLPAEKHNDALSVIRSIAMQSRDDPGCISYSIYRDVEDNNALMAQGIWKTEEDITLHILSEEYRNLLLVVEMSVIQPEIRFDTISSSTGIETIEKIRNIICSE